MMKGKKYWQILFVLSALSLVSGFALHNESSVDINNVAVHTGKLSTQIVVQSSAPLTILGSHYAQDQTATIIVDLKQINPNQEPQFQIQPTSMVENIHFDQNSEGDRMLIRLKEKVPYRIFSQGQETVVELNQLHGARNDDNLTGDGENLKQTITGESLFTAIDFTESEERLDFTARLNRKAVPRVFALNNPLRLVVDLYGAVHSSANIHYPVNKLGVKKVRTAQFQVSDPAITRIVFDLDEPKCYSLKENDNSVIVSFHKHQLPEAEPKNADPVPEDIPVEIDTGSTLTPPLPTTTPPPEISEDPVEHIEDPAAVFPEEIEETPPSVPENYKNPQPQESQFLPRTLQENEQQYSGDLISPRFKDADIRDVILSIGHFMELNVVFDPDVSGTVTCDFTDVPWDQFIDIILKQNKLGKTIEGNVLRVAPIGVLTREQEDQRKITESHELAGPLVVKTMSLSYSRASDVQELLRSKLSERGEIIVDERTNTLVISDVRDRLDLLEGLIAVFDTPTPQVSIEARIVEATSNFVRNLGIQWGWKAAADPFYGNQTSLQFPNKILSDGAMIPQGITTKGMGGPLGGYAINLPAPAFTSAVGISMANILDTFRLDVALTALETSGEGRIVSCPRVTTQNNQEAEILQGRQIPVQTVANFTVTTRYVNAALELRATPQITAEGTIIMRIELRNNAADFANLVNGIPPITMQSAQTTVMVPDGGTTVIGGIYRTEDSITRERIPLLHKIPILGNLFKSFARTKQNRELLIFITPRIIK